MALVRFTVVLLPGNNGLVPKLTVVPAGTPDVADKFIGVTKPPFDTVARLLVATAAPPQVTLVTGGAVKLKPVTGTVIAKLALDTSKKIFPTASTFIFAIVVGELGIVTGSDPSLGVLAKRTVG